MNNSSETVNNTIDLSRLIAIFRNHFKFLIVWTLLIGVLGFVVAEVVVVPKYTAIKDDDFMTKELGLTNLGHINHFHLSHAFRANQVRREDNTHAERRV